MTELLMSSVACSLTLKFIVDTHPNGLWFVRASTIRCTCNDRLLIEDIFDFYIYRCLRVKFVAADCIG